MADGPEAVNSIVLGTEYGQTEPMVGIRSCLILSAVVLSSCAPLSIYHREGVAVSRMQSDLLSCEITALANVPVNNQIRQEPPVYVPARRHCDSSGACTTRGGYFREGRIFTVDLNADLRERAEVQCMAERNYTPVTVPNCPSAVFRAAPKASTQVLPRLRSNSCAIKYRDGTWQIVTRAGQPAP
ncbi:hypothetical protein So717_19320 [Roseobacter cerasinus]|uniref:Uncharacterized protein n=1 Tax=Roseobacter cerasinus TaxID=2602289 RepID=A0A640VQ87_9RHOB|nr:hypothetical protein [Roseobacter cerasinus]GFE50179.1 hypothetical protein So717_19320 [Roseobacter cerasinus]